MKKQYRSFIFCLLVLSFVVSMTISSLNEFDMVVKQQTENPSASLITYVSKSNNLTYEIPMSGKMYGKAEIGQYIMINATFSEFIDEAIFQQNFTHPQGLLENTTLSSQYIFGNKVSYVYYCSGLVGSNNRCYRFKVRNGTDYSYSALSQLEVISGADPSKATNLAVQNSGDGAIELDWTESTDNVNITHYRIYRRINGTIDGTNCEDHFYTQSISSQFRDDSGILEMNTYYYSVKAVDGVGRKSSFQETKSLKPDLTAPTIISGVSFTGILGLAIPITITTQKDCKSVSLIVSYGDDYVIYDPVAMTEISSTSTTTTWVYTIDSNSFFGAPIWEGYYTLRFILTDNFENKNLIPYEYENCLKVTPPGLDPMIIILIVFGAGAAVGIVVFIKIRGKRKVGTSTSSEEEALTRKREIYYGASKIGKMSGEAADAQMAARGKDNTINKPSLREKRIETTVAPRTQSDGITTTSGKQLPSALQMKLEEQKVSIDKKMQFLDSKIDSLVSQLDILSSIISMKKEDVNCPNCNHVMGSTWEVCPFCKIADKDDELGLKKATLSLDSKKTQCPKCGLSLDPSWIKCPRCYFNAQQK